MGGIVNCTKCGTKTALVLKNKRYGVKTEIYRQCQKCGRKYGKVAKL